MLPTLLALLAASSGLLIANAQQVNTPASLTTCQPSQLVIEGGTAPYFVQILPGGQPSAKAIETLPTVYKSGPLTWLVDVPAGTSITLSVTDSTGAINYSSPITVQQGTSSDCLGKNAQVSAAASSPSGSSSTSASSSSSVAVASPSSTTDDDSSSSSPTSIKQETKQLLPSTTAASSTTVVLAATPTQSAQGSSDGAGKNEGRRFALVGGAGLALLLAFA
ncbi:hypothetical protein NBRC10512_000145 [Rhodotorula toruloides]|uniref:RHTO0S08e07866g1_1 n=2 Tax=Rhodotorula toruloides TaxID=5286 RepID=A0A061B259_RHOTO|nr:uncharacterized protein RHTO_00912 [Rhodotorula toruloides NP11]EMS22158.1 hypothetical protein RHTO_00912 [Rhodotorula toruloides NP11]KAJ8294762.1 hypothetical protein OF846_002572 [Rhodotorula toruloides]CDR43914.1 RHTO0S08e07866g1_1 [Rhodotorula toruloides]